MRLSSVCARLNTKAVDRALQAQADRFCSAIPGRGLIAQPSQSGMEGVLEGV